MTLLDVLNLGFNFLALLRLQVVNYVPNLVVQVWAVIHDLCSTSVKELNALEFGDNSPDLVIPNIFLFVKLFK